MGVNWKPLRPHVQQRLAWETKTRFSCLLAGRSGGKSEIAKRYLITKMLKPTWHGQSGIFAYGLPTINQARRVAWKSFKAMIPKEAWEGNEE